MLQEKIQLQSFFNKHPFDIIRLISTPINIGHLLFVHHICDISVHQSSKSFDLLLLQKKWWETHEKREHYNTIKNRCIEHDSIITGKMSIVGETDVKIEPIENSAYRYNSTYIQRHLVISAFPQQNWRLPSYLNFAVCQTQNYARGSYSTLQLNAIIEETILKSWN